MFGYKEKEDFVHFLAGHLQLIRVAPLYNPVEVRCSITGGSIANDVEVQGVWHQSLCRCALYLTCEIRMKVMVQSRSVLQ